MKETVFSNADEVGDFACSFWSEVTFDEVQLGFHEMIRRLEWICEHDREYGPEQTS
jgi:hypothetical protein